MTAISLLIGACFFFIVKLSNLGIRLSDTNVYAYTSLELLQGKLLYKDIFFTNLPLFPYFSSLYLLLSNKNIYFYYFTSTIEVLLTTGLLYLCLKKKIPQHIAACGSLLYLFSFTVLATSDHQTGVFLASLFSVLAYFFFLKKKFFYAGFFLGAMLATKGYFVSIALTYFFYFIFKKKWRNLLSLIGGFFLSLCVIIGPFLLFSGKEFFASTFGYSLLRAPGLNKFEVITFFLTYDLLFAILFFFNLLNIKRSLFFFLFSLFSILFFIFYRDIYYLYFNMLIPYSILSLPFIYTYSKTLLIKKAAPFFVILVFIISSLNFFRYMNGFSTLGKINDIEAIISVVKKARPEYLYGVDSLTPALAVLTDTPLVGNVVDTNENIYRAGILNKDNMTKQALSKKTVIVSRGISYPQFEVEENLAEGIFDKELVKKNCNLISSQPIQAEGAVNRINLFKCY